MSFDGDEMERSELLWCGNGHVVGGLGVMVKEEQCEKVVELWRVSDGVMAVVFVLKRMC